MSSDGNAEWPDPDTFLVNADETEPPSFDPNSLPLQWGEWCKEVASSLGCPIDYVAANLLVAASAFLGNAYRVSPTPDWCEPPHLWIAKVGNPSDGKTPSEKPFNEVANKLEQEEELSWKKTYEIYCDERDVAQAKIDQWKADVKKTVRDQNAPPMRPADAELPKAPPLPRVIVGDGTTQELQNILAGNLKGIFLLRDELAGWIGSFDRYSGAGADRGFFLECWNGARFSVDLVKNGGNPVRIQYASLAILGGIQPDKLQETLSGADDGFAARFGYIWPRPTPYCPLKKESREVSQNRFQVLFTAAQRLRKLAMKYEENKGVVPNIVGLSADALMLFEGIRKEAIHKARSTRGLAAGWHGKTPARALRLALVFEFLDWAIGSIGADRDIPDEISISSMTHAKNYLQYLGQMFERVIGGIAIGQAEADAADIARHILREKMDILNERALYQCEGFSYLRKGDRRQAAFAVLERTGWLRPKEHNGKGRKRADWLVNPKLSAF